MPNFLLLMQELNILFVGRAAVNKLSVDSNVKKLAQVIRDYFLRSDATPGLQTINCFSPIWQFSLRNIGGDFLHHNYRYPILVPYYFSLRHGDRPLQLRGDTLVQISNDTLQDATSRVPRGFVNNPFPFVGNTKRSFADVAVAVLF